MKVKKIISCVVGRKAPQGQTLWTIQPVQVWHKLLRDRSLKAQPKWIEPEFLSSYDWLVSQMKIRIDGYGGGYPWWAYEHRPKVESHVQSGFHVLLQLSLAPERFLLSSYGAWHDVLGDRFFTHPADYNELDDEPTGTQQDKERSWEGIFDVESLRAYDTIQATFETLKLEDVVRYSLFEAAE